MHPHETWITIPYIETENPRIYIKIPVCVVNFDLSNLFILCIVDSIVVLLTDTLNCLHIYVCTKQIIDYI